MQSIKGIQFNNLYSKKYFIPVLIIMLVLLVLVISSSGQGEYAGLYSVIIYLMSAILVSRMFWYKRSVKHTSSRILIRMNSFSGINLEFDSITEIKYIKTKLLITEKGKIHTIKLKA